jgi:hypothetical protein
MNRSICLWKWYATLIQACKLCVAALATSAITACGGGDDGDNSAGNASAAATFAKSYGGPARDQATTARPRPAGGFVFGGTINSRGAGNGLITGTADIGHEGDFWIAALDASGDMQWQRSYGFPSLVPAGAARTGTQYKLARAAFDVERDRLRNGVWLMGRLGAEGSGAEPYVEADADLLSRLVQQLRQWAVPGVRVCVWE